MTRGKVKIIKDFQRYVKELKKHTLSLPEGLETFLEDRLRMEEFHAKHHARRSKQP